MRKNPGPISKQKNNEPSYSKLVTYSYRSYRSILFELLIALYQLSNKYMLFAGWEVRIVKNCDQGLFKSEVTVFHYTDRP